MKKCFIAAAALFCCFSLFAQSHISVPVDDPIYYVLEIAEMRGMCRPLPLVKPYSRAQVLSAIDEILNSPGAEKLTSMERRVLTAAQDQFTVKAPVGLDLWKRGAYHFENSARSGGNLFTGDLGISIKGTMAGAYYMEDGGNAEVAFEGWGAGYTVGDLGSRLSFDFTFSMGLIRAPVWEHDKEEGYWTYYNPNDPNYPSYWNPVGGPPYKSYDRTDSATNINQKIETSTPVTAYFPYTFRKNWDAFVFGGSGAGVREKWPQKRGIGYSMMTELSGDFFDETLFVRFGRMRREWGGMAQGTSLILNPYAQPFLGFEFTYRPAYWFAFSSLTGVLEYFNSDGLGSAWAFQNAYSIEQVEFNYRNYLHVDLGTTVVWPKRFELGYMFPLINNFFYQNNIGDYDNLSMFINARGQYPGLGSIWFSFFMDEVDVGELGKLSVLDRQMFAYQAGIKTFLPIPGFPFASLRVSYTKIEPYTYTHQKIVAPWYGDSPIETSYTNNGVGLGYYLPPNSDELLVRFETRLLPRTSAHLQYQMIRHGADHGPNQVDGSSYLSELDPVGRSSNPILEKHFLRDGAYQWMHIVKFGTDFHMDNVPAMIYIEAGVVFSYYTGYASVNSSSYPRSTAPIVTVGFHYFPR